MTAKPLLTICLLTHNSEKFLEKSLKYILGQTYPNIEVIVSDNQSEDKTEQIIKSFQEWAPKITFRKNALDIKPGKFYDGCYSNCNGCLNSGLINGEFVSFWHQDDVYEEDIARKEAEFLTSNPDVGAVFTLGSIIDESGKIIGEYKLPKELKGKNTYDFTDIFKAILKHGNTFLITPTFMAKREILNKIGIFDYEGAFKTSADLEMWLRIAESCPIAILEEKLINWRVGGGGRTYQRSRTERSDFFAVMDYYLDQAKNYLEIDSKSLRQYEFQKCVDNTLLAANILKNGNVIEAKKLIGKPALFDVFRALFENMKLLRIKVSVLRIVLFIGINMGLGKQLGRVLSKLI